MRRFPSLNEFFAHHEDVRGANGRDPQKHEHAMDETLWRSVRVARRLLARRLRDASLELVLDPPVREMADAFAPYSLRSKHHEAEREQTWATAVLVS